METIRCRICGTTFSSKDERKRARLHLKLCLGQQRQNANPVLSKKSDEVVAHWLRRKR